MKIIMKLLFFDTETTSIKPGNICQLSYIIVDTSTKPQTTMKKCLKEQKLFTDSPLKSFMI